MFKLEELLETLRKFQRDKRAAATLGGGIVGAIVGIMVSLLIAIIVIQSLVASQTQTGWSASANTTWTTLQSNIWVAITLLVIIPIIIGATVILAYVRRGM